MKLQFSLKEFGEITIQDKDAFKSKMDIKVWLKDHINTLNTAYELLEDSSEIDVYCIGDLINLLENIEENISCENNKIDTAIGKLYYKKVCSGWNYIYDSDFNKITDVNNEGLKKIKEIKEISDLTDTLCDNVMWNTSKKELYECLIAFRKEQEEDYLPTFDEVEPYIHRIGKTYCIPNFTDFCW